MRTSTWQLLVFVGARQETHSGGVNEHAQTLYKRRATQSVYNRFSGEMRYVTLVLAA